MARAEALSTIIDAVSCTLCSPLHSQLSNSTSPVNIGLALLKAVWAESASSQFCGLCDCFSCYKSA